MRWRSASALVVAVLALSCLVQQQQEVAAHAPQGVRVLVKHSPLFTAALQQRAAQQGLSVIGQAKGLLVLQAAPPARTQEAGARLASTQHAAHAADTRALLASLMRWPGVQLVEQDQPRFLQGEDAVLSPQQRRRSSAQPADCSASDVPLASGSASSLLPEIQPYGIAQIQADSKRLPSATDGAGVLVCIIDSGVDAAHQDFRGNALDGCKYEDAFAPGGCPFTWSGDMISHGTHVTGTISARRNGEGVVGVIPDGAEVYMVRVFNDSGDVNQGQGLVYGGTLILAYTQCEGRLAALQARDPAKQYRMVVSMSLGAPGPLTIEQLFFREAGKRSDVLFVGSSGNNGTAPTLGSDGKLTTSVNPANFPGTYPEVISVGAVDCNNNLASFSQKAPAVDIAAPGVDILSTGSSMLPSKAGLVRSAFRLDSGGPKLLATGGIASSASQIRFSGLGKASGRVVDCGDGSKPCPDAKGAICLVQWEPRMLPGGLANPAASAPPAAPPAAAPVLLRGAGSSGGSAGRRLLRWLMGAAQPSQPPAGGAGGGGGSSAIPTPAPALVLPGTAPPPSQQQQQQQSQQQQAPLAPTRFTCELMEFCMQQGAVGALFAAPALTSGYYPDLGAAAGAPGAPEYVNWPFYANLRCTAFNCSCWGRLQARAAQQGMLPAAGLTLKQYGELAAAVKANRDVRGTVEAQTDAYQRLSGTSMAVPHVSGALARIWAAYPKCSSADVRRAIEATAKDLGPPGKDTMFGHGLLQAEAAYDHLAKQECGKATAVPPQQQPRQQQPQQPQQSQQPQQQQAQGPSERASRAPEGQGQGQQGGVQAQQQQPAQGRRLIGGGSSSSSSRWQQRARVASGWRQALQQLRRQQQQRLQLDA